MKYIIVSVKHFYMLEEQVNQKISEGYMPLGGPFTNLDDSLCQAMIRETLKSTKLKEKTNVK